MDKIIVIFDNDGDDGGFLFSLLGIVFAIIAPIAIITFSYELYTGGIEWTLWSYYALFADCLFSFAITNIILYFLRKRPDFSEKALKYSLAIFSAISLLLASAIYLIELHLDNNLTGWNIFAGIAIVPVDTLVFALPFIIVEVIIILIWRLILKKKQSKKACQ